MSLENGVINVELTHTDVLKILPNRCVNAHKGDFGRILLLCGSKGYTGAATLSALGALRSGAGLVYLGVPESVYAIEAVKVTEPVVFPLPEENGMFSAKALEQILPMLPNMDAVLIGPGIGRSAGTLAVVESILEAFQGPVVLDADGINVLDGHIDILRGRTSPTILTPHDGEFHRFGGMLTEDRVHSAGVIAAEYGIVVLLKGHRTVITDGENCYINTTGNPGMATGGSGDVLAGIITSLLGQGLPPLEAAACGAWLHGAAGDRAKEIYGTHGMTASNIAEQNHLDKIAEK